MPAPRSSTESAIGRLPGTVEANVAIPTVRDERIRPMLNRSGVECDFDIMPFEGNRRHVDMALSNAFGFGEPNAILVMHRISTALDHPKLVKSASACFCDPDYYSTDQVKRVDLRRVRQR